MVERLLVGDMKQTMGDENREVGLNLNFNLALLSVKIATPTAKIDNKQQKSKNPVR
jgi:hypothetical protein